MQGNFPDQVRETEKEEEGDIQELEPFTTHHLWNYDLVLTVISLS